MIPMMFRKKPALAICDMVICPLPNTTAFGGVATGSIKAHEALIVAGIIKITGCISNSGATEPPRMGSMMVAVAMFDVISVRKVMNVAIEAMTNSG